MLPSLKLINKYFWKSLIGPVIIFVISTIYLYMICTLWSLMGVINWQSVFPTVFGSMIVLIGVYCIPLMINDLRTTIITKRFGSSKISIHTFVFSIFVYYLLIIFIQCTWILGIGFLLFFDDISSYLDCFKYMSVGSLIFSIIITYLLSFSFGIVILLFTKRNFVISVIALLVFVVSLVLAGFAAPVVLIHCMNQNGLTSFYIATSLYYFVYADPFWYTSGLIYNSFFTLSSSTFNLLGSSIFNLTSPLLCKIQNAGQPEWLFTTTEKWLNLIIPFTCIEVFGIVGVLGFKWSIR